MIPHCTLVLNIKIQGLRESESVWVRKVVLLPFAPTPGVKLQLWREDDSTLDIDFVNLVYSMKDSCFIEEQEDDTVRDALQADEEVSIADTVTEYESFGFIVQTGL